jgi:anti-anti-sigma regulatory factor
MLRISYSQTDSGQQWTLCGQLAGPWVQELRSCWEHARRVAAGSGAVVNLSDVTFIDEDGERLLSQMRSAGVEFVATGVDTKHLLQNLKSRGERPLRRSIRCLTGVAEPCGTRDSVRSSPAAARPRRHKEV